MVAEQAANFKGVSPQAPGEVPCVGAGGAQAASGYRYCSSAVADAVIVASVWSY